METVPAIYLAIYLVVVAVELLWFFGPYQPRKR